MAFIAEQTAVIVPVPQVEAAVGAIRERLDPAARAGVPAHVTLVYPFLPADRLDEATIAELRAIVGAQPAFDVTFAGFARFPGVLYLAPEPAEPFRRLTLALLRRWPEAPPYRGAFGTEVIPHLTVSDQASADDEAQAARQVSAHLPISVTVDTAWLIRYDGAVWTQWIRLALR
jgi:2'-5' RNA ligase